MKQIRRATWTATTFGRGTLVTMLLMAAIEKSAGVDHDTGDDNLIVNLSAFSFSVGPWLYTLGPGTAGRY